MPSKPFNEKYVCPTCERTNWRCLEVDRSRPSDTDGIWTNTFSRTVMLIERKPPGFLDDRENGFWFNQGQRKTYQDFLLCVDKCIAYIEFTNNVPWTFPANYIIIEKSYAHQMKRKPPLLIAESRDDLFQALWGRLSGKA